MSKFSKYDKSGKSVSDHIANVNSFIDLMYEKGCDLLVAEIDDLDRRINAGGAPPIFTSKRDHLSVLERLSRDYMKLTISIRITNGDSKGIKCNFSSHIRA